ncbi:hypothetical protein XELAEV_18035088mg [Xenopus laevis]|uniref:Uncharacterized protein n=1 Tax=Xenopus laevis TaxID=8355 RepID=A0A974HBR3_XENLA|nr:hypothetical protein XELAEV_18035088mg [Xenopus laevis]
MSKITILKSSSIKNPSSPTKDRLLPQKSPLVTRLQQGSDFTLLSCRHYTNPSLRPLSFLCQISFKQAQAAPPAPSPFQCEKDISLLTCSARNKPSFHLLQIT